MTDTALLLIVGILLLCSVHRRFYTNVLGQVVLIAELLFLFSFSVVAGIIGLVVSAIYILFVAVSSPMAYLPSPTYGRFTEGFDADKKDEKADADKEVTTPPQVATQKSKEGFSMLDREDALKKGVSSKLVQSPNLNVSHSNVKPFNYYDTPFARY